MACILEKTENPVLQAKFSTLKQLHLQNPQKPSLLTNHNTNAILQTQDAKAIIKTCLWKISQRDLYKPGASRKLPPLEETSGLPLDEKSSTLDALLESSSFGEGMYMDTDKNDYYISDDFLANDDDDDDDDDGADSDYTKMEREDFDLFVNGGDECSLTSAMIEECADSPLVMSSSTHTLDDYDLDLDFPWDNQKYQEEWTHLSSKNDNDGVFHSELDVESSHLCQRGTGNGPCGYGYISSAPILITDGEMLTSDPPETNLAMASPLLLGMGTSLAGMEEESHSQGNLDDDMLCDDI